MEKFSIREVVEQAVQTEKLGYEFYALMSERFKENDSLCRLFSELAMKEQRHEKTFMELLEIIRDEGMENMEQTVEYLRAIAESEFFLGRCKSLPSLLFVKTAEDAVDCAIGFEKETLLYFHGLRKIVKEKEIVDEIINEERSHIMWLLRFKKGQPRSSAT